MKEIQVTRYLTDDGLEFRTRQEAEKHEKGEDISTLEEKLNNLDKVLSKIELPLKEGLKTAPIDIYLTSGADARSIAPKLKAGRYRFFTLRNDNDAETLARYALLSKRLWNEKNGITDSEETTEEDVAENIKEYPCTAFISDAWQGYLDEIGTFIGEIERIEKYCNDNGYAIKLIKNN